MATPARVKPLASVFFRDFDGETVVLDLAGGTYFGLNEIGARVWHAMVDGNSTSQIAELVAREYDVDVERSHADVCRLFDELLARGLVVPE